MSDTLAIRSYRASDREAAWKLHKLALEAVGSPWQGPLAARLDQDFHDVHAMYLNNGGEFLVGTLRGQMIAMGALKRLDADSAEITRMRVHPEFWRRGFGQAILDALEERARARGYRQLWLDTLPVQTFAQRLYVKNGYREFRRVRLGTAELILYEKDLTERFERALSAAAEHAAAPAR